MKSKNNFHSWMKQAIRDEILSLELSEVITEFENKKIQIESKYGFKFTFSYDEFSEICKIKSLIRLKLTYCKIDKIPNSIDNLSNLEYLDLGRNEITDIPKSLGNLKKLKKLVLNVNKITNIPDCLSNLSVLEYLDLEGNEITDIPQYIGGLSSLRTLKLSLNKIQNIADNIGSLTNLELLNLSHNEIITIPTSIKDLEQLTELYFSYNKINNIDKDIDKLCNLIKLDLAKNELIKIPISISKLSHLQYLSLRANKLTNISESVCNLPNLKELDLRNNPLEDLPIEIVDQGLEAIKVFLRQLKEVGKVRINEAKLLIVGEAGAGKTTLAKKIKNPEYELKPDEKATEGIDILKKNFSLDNEEEFQINIWDFGGQEIYHATHRFFLTKRSLYCLVVDNRKEDDNLYYWLNIVELLSDNSPLLIIKNEKQDITRDLDERILRERYDNLKETLSTNLANKEPLDKIFPSIQFYISNLDHIGHELPATWVKVRRTLEKDKRNYIDLNEYLNICQDNGITRKDDKLQLIGYLHDLGVCLHFQDDAKSILYKTVILKPEWGTVAVYKVLQNSKVKEQKGLFTRQDLKNIWNERQYMDMHVELLELMMKFELCYEIPEKKDIFISPQLLSIYQPEYDWDTSNNLILNYTYPDFMPKGIITRFIVVMHQYIDQQKDVWKTGVILNKDHTKAEVIEYYGKREIKIRVAGSYKRELLNTVTYELDKIHDSFNRLKYSKLIPCNCFQCKNIQSPHFYPFQILRQFLADKQYKIQCQKSYEMVNVLTLIDDIVDLQQLISQEKQDIQESINIGGDVQQLVFQLLKQGNIIGDAMAGDRNINIGQGNYNEQKRNNNRISNVTQNSSGSGDNVAGDKNTTNIYNFQDLKQAAAEIQALLKQLEETYPTNTTLGKVAIAEEAIQRIDNNPQLASRILSALKAGGTSALDSLLDHPAASFAIAALEDWQQTQSK